MRTIFYIINFFLVGVKICVSQFYSIPDSNFRSYLKLIYPNTLTTGGDLIISEAGKVSGSFYCFNRNITSLEGIQFFTNITELNVAYNRLSTLPDLSKLTNLTNLTASYNSLLAIPDLSKLGKLSYFEAKNNRIENTPSFIGNDSLKSIDLSYNSIDTIPNWSHLKKLRLLYIYNNKIKSILNIENCENLEQIYCYYNEISNAPNFSRMKKLNYIDISHNQLPVAPVLASPNKVQIMYANNNNIASIPDSYSNIGNILGFYFNYNNLTFSQLNKFIPNNNYDTLIHTSNQAIQKNAQTKLVRENTDLVLTISIDKDVDGVVYDWYKNGFYFATTTINSITISNLKLKDSAKYHTVIRSNYFMKTTIGTDTTVVKIFPCNDINKISFVISDIDCMNPGQITVIDNNVEASTNKYILEGNESTNSIHATNKAFKGLTELKYSFKVVTSDGCEKKTTTPLSLSQVPCNEILIYPDANSENTYHFSESGTIKIFDKHGNMVNKLDGPILWTGIDDKSRKLPSGFYVAEINDGEKLLGITILY